MEFSRPYYKKSLASRIWFKLKCSIVLKGLIILLVLAVISAIAVACYPPKNSSGLGITVSQIYVTLTYDPYSPPQYNLAPYNLMARLELSNSVVPGQDYDFLLYENGQYRDDRHYSFTQAQINTGQTDIGFVISQDEWNTYLQDESVKSEGMYIGTGDPKYLHDWQGVFTIKISKVE